MSDIPDFQLFVIMFASLGLWLAGFQHGKWAGIQKAEKRQRLIDRTQKDLEAVREGYKRR